MDDESRYRTEAEKAERAAKRAPTESERAAYLQIAEGWRKLLAQRGANKRFG